MTAQDKPEPGSLVRLTIIPPAFVDDLPESDRKAILAAALEPLVLDAYDEAGRAELRFTDEGVIHWLYVDPAFIETA